MVAVLLAAGAALWLWARSRPHAESALCDALDAEADAITERQYHLVAQIAATDDPAARALAADELAALERRYNQIAEQQAGLADCEPRHTYEP